MLDKIQNIQKHIGKLSKDTKGYNYKYFDINQLLEKLQPLLQAEGLVLTQPIIDGSVVSRITRPKRVDVNTGDDEEEMFIESSIKLPDNVKPQDLGSAITYYRRYTLVSLLALEAEDDDGKKASTPPASKGISEEIFNRLQNAYKEKGVITPEMIPYYEKCSPEQKKIINDIKKELRK
jgi:hypothetical protein